jgi:hypothetical protein
VGWSAEDIEKKLLKGRLDSLALSHKNVVSAFNRVEKLLGPEWIKSETSATGLFSVMGVTGMGLRLTAVEGVAEADKLIKRIRDGDRSAEAELTAVYLLRSYGPSVELQVQPSVGQRKADFRVQNGSGQWTTVEVTQPNASKENERVTEILQTLTGALREAHRQFALEVVFRREPAEEELTLLCQRLAEFCELQGQQQADLSDGLGFLFLNQIPIGHLLKRKIVGLADTPMIGLAMFVGGGPGGGPHHQVHVRIPFTDHRAEEILRDEARQLPQDEPGLVMIDVASSSGAFESWSALIKRRFQPTIHTRISGVCLFEGAGVPTEKGYDWLLRTLLVTNPYARFPLPAWIQSAVTSAGKEFERISSSW